MNKFQKIAIFLVRLLGIVFLLFGVNGFVYAAMLVISPIFKIEGYDSTQGIISGAFYFILGLALVLFSNPLGKLIGSGLDDEI